ncbi:MAG: glycosyltransferase [Methanobacterium sp.]|nr:glycosyltransferase [Methanobacterium sp.]
MKKSTQLTGMKAEKTSLREYPRKIGRKVKAKIKGTNKPNRDSRSFRDFSGFLKNSMISPVIHAPFREQDKRCFATMENISKYLESMALTNMDDLVTVVLPVHNRVGTVRSSIESVLNQTYTKFELIIIDDGSDDGSDELLKSINDERIVLMYNKERGGVSKARNMGLESAKGKYVAYLDSDNMWDPRYLAAMVGAFKKLPDADAVYSGQFLYKGDNKHPYAVRFGSFNRSLLNNRNYIDINSLCHKRELVENVGVFDESLERLVDYDLILRISESAQIYSVPVLLSYYYFDNAENTITNIPGYVSYLETVREKRDIRKERKSRELSNSGPTLDQGVSIIIPNYEALEDLKECFNSIQELYGSEVEVVVVDNASSKPVTDYLDDMADNNRIKLIKNVVNYGFTYAVNQGIEISKPENDILLMNNDSILTPGSIEALQKTAHKLSDAGIVVPQQVLPAETKTINEHVPFAYSWYECDVNLSKAHNNIINVPVFHSGNVVELSFAPFFCVYIKREVLDSSVGLDPEYGRHYRSDRVYCNFIRHIMNLKVYYVVDAVVYHKLQKSTDDLSSKPSKGTSFDLMFKKNQWDEELAAELGYKKPVWDF